MTDFNGAKPVKTIRDDEFKIKIVDGASGDSATKILSVVEAGDTYSASTNDYGVPAMGKDVDGKAVIIPVPLPITDNGGAITVDASDLDIRDLTHASDSVKVGDGTDFLAVNTDGSINVVITDGSGSITVDASDLDIRDLTHASDSIKVGDGTDFLAVNDDGSINAVISDGSGSITVDASDLDIRDLTHASDSIKVGDGTDFLAVNTDGSINVVVTELGTAVLSV
jgi:hypothetical protein